MALLHMSHEDAKRLFPDIEACVSGFVARTQLFLFICPQLLSPGLEIFRLAHFITSISPDLVFRLWFFVPTHATHKERAYEERAKMQRWCVGKAAHQSTNGQRAGFPTAQPGQRSRRVTAA